MQIKDEFAFGDDDDDDDDDDFERMTLTKMATMLIGR